MAGLTEEQWDHVLTGLGKIEDLDRRIEKLDLLPERMKSLEIAILGNGCEGLKDTVYKMKAEIETLKKAPPRFSWAQVVANSTLILILGTFLYGDKAITTNLLSQKISDNQIQVNKQITDLQSNTLSIKDNLEHHIQGTK